MIENLGNIGDFVGGVGVFVALIYLAILVRQNTRSLRLSSIQQIMGTSVSVNQKAADGPIPVIVAKLETGERLSDGEFAQYLMHIWAMLTHQWQVYHQFQNGMIDVSVFDSYVARLKLIFSTSLSREIWRTHVKLSFPDDFQNFVSDQIEGSS